jgi:hypothetical protein
MKTDAEVPNGECHDDEEVPNGECHDDEDVTNGEGHDDEEVTNGKGHDDEEITNRDNSGAIDDESREFFTDKQTEAAQVHHLSLLERLEAIVRASEAFY